MLSNLAGVVAWRRARWVAVGLLVANEVRGVAVAMDVWRATHGGREMTTLESEALGAAVLALGCLGAKWLGKAMRRRRAVARRLGLR